MSNTVLFQRGSGGTQDITIGFEYTQNNGPAHWQTKDVLVPPVPSGFPESVKLASAGELSVAYANPQPLKGSIWSAFIIFVNGSSLAQVNCWISDQGVIDTSSFQSEGSVSDQIIIKGNTVMLPPDFDLKK